LNPYWALYEDLLKPLWAEIGSHKANVVALIICWTFGLSLIWAAQWQQEILDIIIRDTQGNGCYWLPAYFLGCQNVWQWRDYWDWATWIGAVGFFGFGTFLSMLFWTD
jgi:hypothetical protein